MRDGSRSRIRLLDPFAQRREIKEIWEPLSEASGASYFLSWPWVENWLATLPPTTALQLLVVDRETDRPGASAVAACFIGRRTMLRSRVIPTRARFVNATGSPEFDEICVEHNGWIARDGFGLRELVDAIPGEWDELMLDAMDPLPGPSPSASSFWPSRVQVRSTRPCYSVSLDKVRAAKGSDYLSLLAGDLRSQIRRSYKLYQERGPITVTVAKDLEEARGFYQEMVALHQVTWAQRGQPGAFALPYFRWFHERLIETRIAFGDIQLMRIRAGNTTLGCLYNYLWKGDVLFYQSGITYESDNRLKPGLVCHAEAVKYNAAQGALVYDFLAGDARYKRGLSTDVRTMSWLAVQRPRVRFLLEDIVRNTSQAWRIHHPPPPLATTSKGTSIQATTTTL